MICPNCNQEVTGKYCSYCGALLETEEPKNDMPSDSVTASENTTLKKEQKNKPAKKPSKNTSVQTTKQTTKQKTKVKKKKKKKGRISNTVSGAVSGSLSAAGSITTGSVKTVWKLFMSVIQWLSGGLMLLITWKMFLGFWAQRTTLGSIRGIIQERNINQAAYLLLAVCLVAFGILQVLWIISRKKMPDNGKVRRLDMGRGLFGFLAFFLLVLVSYYVNPLLPEHPYPLPGVKQIFSVITGLGKPFATLNLTGIVLCIIRKVGTR